MAETATGTASASGSSHAGSSTSVHSTPAVMSSDSAVASTKVAAVGLPDNTPTQNGVDNGPVRKQGARLPSNACFDFYHGKCGRQLCRFRHVAPDAVFSHEQVRNCIELEVALF
jgi:hypothetical protein